MIVWVQTTCLRCGRPHLPEMYRSAGVWPFYYVRPYMPSWLTVVRVAALVGSPGTWCRCGL